MMGGAKVLPDQIRITVHLGHAITIWRVARRRVLDNQPAIGGHLGGVPMHEVVFLRIGDRGCLIVDHAKGHAPFMDNIAIHIDQHGMGTIAR